MRGHLIPSDGAPPSSLDPALFSAAALAQELATYPNGNGSAVYLFPDLLLVCRIPIARFAEPEFLI